jgi:hypothetical protein
MLASPIAVAGAIRFVAHYVLAGLALFLNPAAATRVGSGAQPCYVAVTAVVSLPAPYRVARVVTTGVREYEDDGTGTAAYCEPLDVARLHAARAAIDRQIETSHQAEQNVERVVIRSTSATVVAQHLVYVAASGHAFAEFHGVEVVTLEAPNGTEYRELPLPSLLPTDSARAACDSANVALRQNAAPFHWAC